MRVLFITYPMAFHTPGGGEVQLLNYKKALEGKGVEVKLFDPWDPNFNNYDLVHFFSCIGGSEPICHFVSSLGLPLVITSSLWITEKTRHLYDVENIKAQLRWADRILTNSLMECEELARTLDIGMEKFRYVHNAVSRVFIGAKRSRGFVETFSINKPYVLNVANIEPRKNQHMLIEAMKAFPDHKLIIVGNIRDKKYFERCNIDKNPQVKFVGMLEPDSKILVSAYQNAASFALPSTLETPGISALEAAACGVPVVITREGSTKEYFVDSNVQFVDCLDLESIANGIRKSIKNGRAETVCRGQTWDDVVDQLIDVYGELVF